MTAKKAPEFEEMFDEDGEVVVTDNPKQQSELGPQPQREEVPTAHYFITNRNIKEGAELNLFFKCPGGFKGHLKLYGPNGKHVLEKSASAALLYLNSNGYEPEYGSSNGDTAEPSREDLPADGTASKAWCGIHKCEMKRRESDSGDVWYSHQTKDPDYKSGWS